MPKQEGQKKTAVNRSNHEVTAGVGGCSKTVTTTTRRPWSRASNTFPQPSNRGKPARHTRGKGTRGKMFGLKGEGHLIFVRFVAYCAPAPSPHTVLAL